MQSAAVLFRKIPREQRPYTRRRMEFRSHDDNTSEQRCGAALATVLSPCRAPLFFGRPSNENRPILHASNLALLPVPRPCHLVFTALSSPSFAFTAPADSRGPLLDHQVSIRSWLSWPLPYPTRAPILRPRPRQKSTHTVNTSRTHSPN